jgi:hypothetical protein
LEKFKNLFNYWQQTCTSDMLELAVEYINDLQKELKVLKEEVSLDN